MKRRTRIHQIEIFGLSLTVILLLVADPSIASSTKVEVGAITVHVVAGSTLPVVIDHDDSGTPSDLGDDSASLFQNVERVAVRVDPKGSPTPDLSPAPASASRKVELDLSDTRVYNDLWPTVTEVNVEYQKHAPAPARETLYFHFPPEGWDVGYCVLGIEELAGIPFFASCRPFPNAKSYPGYGYTYWTFNASFDYASTDWYVGLAEYEYAAPCRLLAVFKLNYCHTPGVPFPSSAFYERTPDVRFGYRFGTGSLAIGDGDDPKGAVDQRAPSRVTDLPDVSTPQAPAEEPLGPYHGAVQAIGAGLESAGRLGAGTLDSSSAREGNPGVVDLPFPSVFLAVFVMALLLPALLLYHRLTRDSVLSNPTRVRMLETIRAEPGIHERALAARLEVHPTTVHYHARVLRLHKLIEVERTTNEKCYFENGGRFPRDEKLRIVATRADAAQRVLEVIHRRGPTPLSNLASEVGIRRQSLAGHLQALHQAGLIRVRRSGRFALVELAPDGTSFSTRLSTSTPVP